ncbi:MAG: tetratricopeptide repeat protein [Kofleriaceae bacterium]
MRRLLVALWVALAIAGPAFAETKSDALPILDRAISKEKDPKALAQALAELDAVIAKNPKDPIAYYSRGWVLSRTGKNADAVIAYDRAFELDARVADAAYNAGVVLGRVGNSVDAAVRFDRALKANPQHVDAAFNAGQIYYDLKDYAKAAARWEAAAKLSPEDFQVAKKLVQAYVAAGKSVPLKRARDRVIAMWKSGKDPELGKQRSYLYDQFAAGKYYVYVYEAFDTSTDLTHVWQAKVTLKDKPVGSINLETSAALRERGMAFGIGVDKGSEHSALVEHQWKKQPDYKVYKALVARLVDARF